LALDHQPKRAKEHLSPARKALMNRVARSMLMHGGPVSIQDASENSDGW
jgi:hypothetical protein